MDSSDTPKKCRAIILAAGQGTRMKSDRAKVLHCILGRPIINIVMNAVKEAGLGRPVVVIGHQAGAVENAVGDEADCVLQETQAGTGHAVRLGMNFLEDHEGTVAVVYGDTPLIQADFLMSMLKSHDSSGAACTVATTILKDPYGYGRVLRDESGQVLEVVEEKDATAAQRSIKEVLGGLFFFDADLLREGLSVLTNNNALGEYCLPHVIKWLSGRGVKVNAFTADPPELIMGINTRAELASASDVIRLRILKRWMDAGVEIVDTASTFIDFDVTLEPDSTVYPFTYLEGKTVISEGAVLGPFAHIIDSAIGRGARVWHSVVEGSRVSHDAVIGPFSHVRPGCNVGANSRIGNFAELKGSNIGSGTKINHHSYIGDADVGEGVNIGAGVITVNYDGKQKHRTSIGHGAFVGCNANLVAPTVIGRKAYVAAGSTITENVPDEALGIARGRQVNKEGWVSRKDKG